MQDTRTPSLTGRLKRLNARQRKKLRIGEFSEQGFSLKATLTSGLDPAAQDALLDAWLVAVDEQKVSFGGQFDVRGALEGIVFPVGATLVTADVRTALLDWLKGRAEIADLQASEIFDIWHGT
jgi:uncharacterized protein